MNFFVSIGIFAAATLAFPSAIPSFTKQPFVETCTGPEIRDGWLFGNCLSGNGDERIESSVYLSGYLLPPDFFESFRWAAQKREGKTWYSDHCSTCTMVGDVASCLCETSRGYGPPPYNISLGEHIFNYAGHLLPNIFGEPTTIPIDKHFPVPHAMSNEPGESDGFRWWLYLGPSQKCDIDHLSIDGHQMIYDEPKACAHVTNVTRLLLYSESRDKTAYYRVSVYSEKDCRESSLLRVLEDFETSCSEFGSPVGAIKVEAKWNWV